MLGKRIQLPKTWETDPARLNTSKASLQDWDTD